MKIKVSELLNNKKLPDFEFELNESDCAKAFGLSLKRARKYHSLTLDELSEKVEIPNPTLNRYESGYNLPSIFMALKIVNFFNTNIESMITAGLFELYDIKNNQISENNQYVEQFLGISDKLDKLFNNKTKVVFNDHKKKRVVKGKS